MSIFDNVTPQLVDFFLPQHDGYPEELAELDTREALMQAADDAGAVVTEFSNAYYIEPKDRPELARHLTETKNWGINFLDRYTNQNPTHECTCHSLRACFESAWNRQRSISLGGPVAGQRLDISAKSASVWVSPLSIYAEANPRERGGANVQQVLRIAAKRGFLPETIQPKDYNFKHALHGTVGKGGINQAKGPWTPVSRFPDGWTDTSKHFRPLEYIFPENMDQGECLLLNKLMIGVGRQGHAIPYGAIDYDKDLIAYPDSYDVTRFDSFRTARSCIGNGSFAIVTTTVPDDWDKPAG